MFLRKSFIQIHEVSEEPERTGKGGGSELNAFS